MKKLNLLFTILLIGTFSLSSFMKNESNIKDLGVPCGATAVGYVYHPSYDFNHTLVFYVTGIEESASNTYSWVFTRQNGTTFTASGFRPNIVTSCSFGQRITGWKLTISGSCTQTLQGSQSSGAC